MNVSSARRSEGWTVWPKVGGFNSAVGRKMTPIEGNNEKEVKVKDLYIERQKRRQRKRVP